MTNNDHLDKLRRESRVPETTPERTPEKSSLSGGEQQNGAATTKTNLPHDKGAA
jgi:hypothetical protein